ncbi:hypothetical protein [Actinoplanes sp. NPDC051851]|uniref:hypothetical protein n=1 Tax=Actinoplanes sp. NPDC051851 TaxID=3154753 RepID=UPI0034488649
MTNGDAPASVPLVLNSFDGLILISGTPTYETCTDNALAYSGTAPKEQITEGAAFCVKTGERRIAGVIVTGVQKGLTAISITATVWG